MPRDGGASENLVTVASLRQRVSRVRRLMGGMLSKTDHDRLRDYVEALERRTVELEREESSE